MFNGSSLGADGKPLFNRVAMGARFKCSAILSNNQRCSGVIVPKIQRRA